MCETERLRGRKVENSKLDNPGTLTADPIKVKLRKAEKKPQLKYYRKS